MEEWVVSNSTGEYYFNSLTDAIAWLSQQTPSPTLIHRKTKRHYVSYGLPGTQPWPSPSKASFTAETISITKMKQSGG